VREVQVSYLENVHKEVLRVLKSKAIKAQRYLDIGCNNGAFTMEVIKVVRAKEVYGVDILDEVLDELPPLIRAVKLDIFVEKLPFPDGYFDLITAIELLKHIP